MNSVIATTTLLIAASLAGCVAAPEKNGDWLDNRLAWPCDRLLLVWSVDASKLQSVVATSLNPRTENNNGELHLNILRCEPIGAARGRATPLLYAMLTIPVAADTVPMVISSIPADGWYSLPQVIADANTATIFGQLGYDVVDADVSFPELPADLKTPFELRITFDAGQITVRTVLGGELIDHDISMALLEGGVDYWAALFGEESGKRYAGIEAEVWIEGETPFSTFDLLEHPCAVVFDRALVSNRFYWRFPLLKP